MVRMLSGFPVHELQCTRDGDVHDDDERRALLRHVEATTPRRLLVLAHGWNNDMAQARRLYRRLLRELREVGVDPDGTTVLGVLWPSKKFAEADLVPSGAASLGGPAPVGVGEVRQHVEDVRDVLDLTDGDVVRLRSLADDLEDDPAARERFAQLVLAHVPDDALGDGEQADALAAADRSQVLDLLAAPVLPADVPPADGELGGAAGGVGGVGGAGGVGGGGVGGAGGIGGGVGGGGAGVAGGDGTAAGLGSLFSGVRGGARNLLNLLTYYAMKARAGSVGTRGLAPVLAEVRERSPDTALHLVGHSFGGRLVTAAALGGEGAPPLGVDGMLLLQAAFSHHGFAQDFEGTRDGAFRRVLTEQRVAGPVVVTHTANDRAVGLAYPLASRLAGHVASRLGDADDRFGGIGANGAVHTPEAVAGVLRDDGASEPLVAGRVLNLRADHTIANHMDVANTATASVLAQLLATTP